MYAYKPLVVTVTVVMVIAAVVVEDARGRELRPSVHGLDYQSNSPAGKKLSPETKAFFGASSSSSSYSSSSSSSSSGAGSGVELPRAMNADDASWWRSVSRRGGKGDHVRHVLLVTSLVCGVAGVSLLVASLLIYFIRRNNNKKKNQINADDNNNNTDNANSSNK